MQIDFAKLQYQYQRYKAEIDEAIHAVLDKSNYIMGNEVYTLEENLCAFTGARHAVTCASGTDALLLAMMALDIRPGDEVITTPFTFIATAETIALLGAKPVFVDIDEKTYNIDPSKIETAVTDRTKAVMPVSLYGQPSDMDEINAIANKYDLKVIIDGAQSFGATYQGRAEVHHCDIYTTSFFPAKPLGCFGDGGAVLTNNEGLADKMRMLRVHGQNKRYHHKYIGLGARMDTLQCAVVNVKLKYYGDDLERRRKVAKKYTTRLITHHALSQENRSLRSDFLVPPAVHSDRTSSWAQYTIRVQNRDKIQKRLKEAGIPTAVHYPMPLHLQECFAYLGYRQGSFSKAEQACKEVVSLPMNPYMAESEIAYVVKAL